MQMRLSHMSDNPGQSSAERANNPANQLLIRARTQLPTFYGDYTLYAFSDVPDDAMPHLALVAEGMSA